MQALHDDALVCLRILDKTWKNTEGRSRYIGRQWTSPAVKGWQRSLFSRLGSTLAPHRQLARVILNASTQHMRRPRPGSN